MNARQHDASTPVVLIDIACRGGRSVRQLSIRSVFVARPPPLQHQHPDPEPPPDIMAISKTGRFGIADNNQPSLTEPAGAGSNAGDNADAVGREPDGVGAIANGGRKLSDGTDVNPPGGGSNSEAFPDRPLREPLITGTSS